MSGAGLAEVAGVFLRLGCLSFGGPVAHLAYLQAELVARRRWLTAAHYADLVALCQFLPGPASSQVVFALGRHRAGLAGALVASVAFTLPSAALMLAFGLSLAAGGAGASWGPAATGALRGLKLAAVAVVAHAVWDLGRRLCPDRARQGLCLVAAALLLALPGAWTQIGVIALGAAWGLARRPLGPAPAEAAPAEGVRGSAGPEASTRGAVAALAVFASLLVLLPWLARATGSLALAHFDAFYRAGSLVFGGGHVVLPLLRAEVVPPGWLSDAQFLSAYAAAQAVPGPLFSLAAGLGAAMGPPAGGLGRGLWTLGAIFLPAWLLVGGVLPFWDRLRRRARVQAALAGANAAVVGVLLAALYDPVFVEGVRGPRDLAAALGAFGLLALVRAPAWVPVALLAAGGALLG